MIVFRNLLLAGVFACLAGPGFADMPDRTIGGDIIRYGQTSTPLQAPRVTFCGWPRDDTRRRLRC